MSLITKIDLNGRECYKVDGAELGPWRSNFSGEKNKFGDSARCFYLRLDEAQAADLIEEGVNVKQTNPSPDSGYEPEYYVKVKVKYHDGEQKRFDPKLYLCGKNGRALLNIDTVGNLDGCRFDDVKLTLSPYTSEVQGKTWTTLWCQEGFFFPQVTSAWEDDMLDIPTDDGNIPF